MISSKTVLFGLKFHMKMNFMLIYIFTAKIDQEVPYTNLTMPSQKIP